MTAALRKTSTSAPTSAELEGQLLAEREALERAEARLVELQRERDAALLADDDAPLADAEQAIEATCRQRDRHAARTELLERAHEEQLEAERHAAALERYEAACAEIAAARQWQLERYPQLAAELAEGLSRLKAADELADRVNRHGLPSGCLPVAAPSRARHEPASEDRRETRRLRRWVDRSGRPVGAVQLNAGEPNAHGVRLVEVEEEVVVSGQRPWFPEPIYAVVGELPGLRRGDSRFWPTES